MTEVQKIRVVVLISGSGSNLQSIIDACEQPTFPAQVIAVISNKPNVFGLQRAAQAGIDSAVVDHTDFASRVDFDRALSEAIDLHRPDLVVLAGFMRILTPEFVEHYLGRMLNIHPSLLPKYPGLHTHKRAIEAGDALHGATVHFVTAELDGGPPVVQARVAVAPDDTEQSLAKRVLAEEHRIYPYAIGLFGSGRLLLQEGRAMLDGGELPVPVEIENSAT